MSYVLDMEKCPQIMQTAYTVLTFEHQFDGAFMHVSPHTSTTIQKILNFSLFSSFMNSSDHHKAGVCIKNKYIAAKSVCFQLKFSILGDLEIISLTCPMSCPVSSNFTGQDIGQSQLSKIYKSTILFKQVKLILYVYKLYVFLLYRYLI